jgi:hypothetical protein
MVLGPIFSSQRRCISRAKRVNSSLPDSHEASSCATTPSSLLLRFVSRAQHQVIWLADDHGESRRDGRIRVEHQGTDLDCDRRYILREGLDHGAVATGEVLRHQDGDMPGIGRARSFSVPSGARSLRHGNATQCRLNEPFLNEVLRAWSWCEFESGIGVSASLPRAGSRTEPRANAPAPTAFQSGRVSLAVAHVKYECLHPGHFRRGRRPARLGMGSFAQ